MEAEFFRDGLRDGFVISVQGMKKRSDDDNAWKDQQAAREKRIK
jgi:hypothetical protein